MRLLPTLVSPAVAIALALAVVPASPEQAPVSETMIRARVIAASVTKADEAAEARYREAAARDVPTDGSSAEAAAIALADHLQAVPVAEGGEPCPADRLEVAWSEPAAGYRHGAFVPPLGPAPDATSEAVNGIVLCTGAPYAFMGFEATLAEGGGWLVTAVPFLGGEGDTHANDDGEAGRPQGDGHGDAPEPAGPPSTEEPVALPPDGSFGAIEGYAAYEPQRICDATAKPGTRALMHLLLGQYPGTRNLGIVRGCSVGGRSEHKEGRAFDWGARVDRPAEREAVEEFVTRLLVTDSEGNRHALARRMGVMYMIWNRQIWSAYRPDAGWRPYHGPSPHLDHLHVSLSWNGAMGRTSFWEASGVEPARTMPAGAVLAAPVGQQPADAPASNGAPAATESGDRSASDGRGEDRERAREDRREERQAQKQAERDERERERQERREQRQRERDERRAQKQAERDERRAQKQAEREERRAQKQAEREERQREREEKKRQREEARAERERQREERREQREREREERREQRERERADAPSPAPQVPSPAPGVEAPTEGGETPPPEA